MKSLQLEKPHAIIVIGIQGSGKSFFAEKFADTFNAPFVEQAAFMRAAKDLPAAEALVQDMLKQMLKTGRSVVVELALSSRTERAELSKQMRKAGYVPLFVWVQVDTETAMNRAQRGSGISAADYQTNLRRFNAPHATERALVISGKHTFATQAKAVLKKLSAPRQIIRPSVEPRPHSRGQIIIR